MNTDPAQTIDTYIAAFPEEIQTILQKIRSTIHETAPDAQETVKYAMPTFTLHGNLIHFAAFKKHIGLYPVPSAIEAFKEELSVYQTSKGAVQFPLDQPIPYDLIRRIVIFRVNESIAKADAKKKKSNNKPSTQESK